VIRNVLISMVAVCLLSACSSVYYDIAEQFGVHKRDILVDRVEEARDAQEDAKQQFSSALEQFASVVAFDGGDLQEKYDSLNASFEDSESRAEAVTSRINAVEDVSDALFSEWEAELEQYTSASLKSASKRQLRSTRTSYGKMIKAMRSAESRMEPVLNAFRDQVLFLKHNLNARAIASLKSEFGNIKTDINRLIREMESSIEESNKFVESLL